MKVLRPLHIQQGLERQRRRSFLQLSRAITSQKEPMPPPNKSAVLDNTANEEQPAAIVGELRIKATADRLGLSVRDLASTGGIGASTMHQLITLNQWPKRTVVRKAAILELLKSSGATDHELQHAFELASVAKTEPTVPAAPAGKKHDQTGLETEMLMGKQSLSMAARKAFSLFNNPFDGEVSSEAEMFLSGEIRFIREACWQTAVNGAFVAVMGESGAGKSTILADLKDRMHTSSRPIIVIEPSVLGMGQSNTSAKMIKSGDILAACIATLDPGASMRVSIEGRTRQFMQLLEASVKAGNSHMLVIEEAHDMPRPTFRHLKRLHEKARIGRRSALGILLIAHPELRNMLNERSHDLREVFQRCEMLELLPLDKDLRSYLEHRAKLAGRALSELITDDGIEEIRARMTIERRVNNGQATRTISLLYPLAVNNLMTAALNEAAALGAPIVDKDIVRAL